MVLPSPIAQIGNSPLTVDVIRNKHCLVRVLLQDQSLGAVPQTSRSPQNVFRFDVKNASKHVFQQKRKGKKKRREGITFPLYSCSNGRPRLLQATSSCGSLTTCPTTTIRPLGSFGVMTNGLRPPPPIVEQHVILRA